MTIEYAWRGAFDNHEVNRLHAEGFDHPLRTEDRRGQVERHSLGWVCARHDGQLVGFVNVAWDGAIHAFVIDTLVTTSARRQGCRRRDGRALPAGSSRRRMRVVACGLREHLGAFYFDACGFTPTTAGLIEL